MEKYERIRVVGRGAFGIVHLCLRKADQKLVIIKQIPVEQMTKEERQAAQNECQVLKLLNHPNVIEYYENFLEDKALMIAMEYAPGGTLAEFIQKRCNSLLEEETILHFFVQILLALHHVHTHLILHRDLKTQNILLDKHRMVVKIGDFGISKILSSKSKAYTVVGTPCYISPELCEGKPYNQKSDIWALGCVLYELASLKRAFEAANLPALVLKIMSGTFAPISDRYSPELRQLVLSLLSLEPAQRPPLSHIMAQPLCIRALLNLHTDLGSVRMRRPVQGEGRGPWVAVGGPSGSTGGLARRGAWDKSSLPACGKGPGPEAPAPSTPGQRSPRPPGHPWSRAAPGAGPVAPVAEASPGDLRGQPFLRRCHLCTRGAAGSARHFGCQCSTPKWSRWQLGAPRRPASRAPGASSYGRPRHHHDFWQRQQWVPRPWQPQ
uniref:NIMA related kinase 8 n=1 Tax=Sus scrofa TaxID=9823 RepID=A0A4X1TPI4_PIG